MKSGQAHAWLFIDLINVHLAEYIDDADGQWAPDECGPCGALRDYWLTPRGRAEAQAYMNQLEPDNRNWSWCPFGVIDWAEIERRAAEHGQREGPLVWVRKKVYDEMVEDQKLLIALQNAGVDNWEGWSPVLDEINEMG